MSGALDPPPPARIPCAHCGLPVRVRRPEPGRRYYCCTGCSFLGNLPAGATAGQFPVTRDLLVLLATGFVFFNQLLCALFAFLVRDDGRAALADRLQLVSLGLGATVALVLLVSQWRSDARDWRDLLVFLATGALLGSAVALRMTFTGVVATTLLVIWSTRGFLRGALRKKPSVTKSPEGG
ncbi:hypothetical protein OpiT1DRAFT_04015 [Opitutaceae bacterium TAV1]|nr:hypothetical protein OpiT1DRAFT_04015 [Opitutaceae bacterium TAV1]